MSMKLAPNVVIADRFRLNREIGRGGMGSVWHATHLGLDMPCAVKFIEGEMSLLSEAQARFEREAKAAAQLRSPHVVQILDHGVWQGTPYIAMELLDGEELGKRLGRLKRLTPPEVLQIVLPICRALTRAHLLGIVHRDLKPDNIFLVRDDDREIAKVLDFGIAKATGAGLDASNTRTGAMLGTPYYMSPEQAQGIKAVDARSDLWSLAVIVFQMLTGVLPFESEALGDLLVKIIVAPVPIPSHVAVGLPPAFDGWWAKASQRDPALRYQTARELGETLARALGDAAAEAPAPEGRRSAPLLVKVPAPGSAFGAMRTGAPTSHTASARAGALAGTTRALKPFGWLVKGGGALVALVLAAVAVSFALKTMRHEAPAVRATASTPAAPMTPANAASPSPVVAQAPEAYSAVAIPSVVESAAAPPKARVPPEVASARTPHAAGAAVVTPLPPPKPAAPSSAAPPPMPKRKTIDLGI